jgi:tRNA modification GTPase
VFIVVNKSDLPPAIAAREIENLAGGSPIYEISAERKEGIDRLREEIISRITGGEIAGRNSALLLDAWERDLLQRMHRAVKGVAEAIERLSSPDIIAEELRCAHEIAGELQGIDIDEEVLDQLFRRFCVGK